MRLTALLALPALAIAAPLAAHEVLPAGIWTNTEDVYFAEEEGREKAERVMLQINENGEWRRIDFYGAPQGDWSKEAIPGLNRREDGGWQIGASELRQARDFSCWVSVKKFASKPDGSDDWTWQGNLAMQDQGGQIAIPGNGVAPDVMIRMRNVTWAKGSSNAPSTVLYVHKDDPVRAESYAWGSPETRRVGVNLRWVQASCTLAEDNYSPR